MTRARISLLIIGGAACAGLLAALVMEFAPRFVWNGSASAPKGLYFIERGTPRRGEFALVAPRKEIALFIEKRRYLPPETPLVKRVAAADSDEICRENETIFINEEAVATALLRDSMGRDMPRWSGCFTLGPDEFFLLNDHPKSLDGRYFGAMSGDEIAGVARPIWTRDNAHRTVMRKQMEG